MFSGYTQRFNLYCGQAQRELTNEQKEVMRKIAEYVVNDGAFTLMELSQFDPELWKTAMIGFAKKAAVLTAEMQQLSKFILKVA